MESNTTTAQKSSQSSPVKIPVYKIVVLGEGGVGKSGDLSLLISIWLIRLVVEFIIFGSESVKFLDQIYFWISTVEGLIDL